MVTTGETQPDRVSPLWSAAGRYEVPARRVLIVAWLLVVCAMAVLGAGRSQLSQLQGPLSRGDVDHVVVAGPGLTPGQGYVIQEVRWRHHLVAHVARVAVLSSTQDYDLSPEDDDALITRITAADLGDHLVSRQPGLDVERRGAPDATARAFDWIVPTWLGVAFLVVELLCLVLLRFTREPWRATPTAWVLLWFTPIGAPAFLLFGGPGSPIGPPKDPDRRLTGGWALLLGIPLAGRVFWPN